MLKNIGWNEKTSCSIFSAYNILKNSVSYNTTGQFTARNDTDYGNWTINAYLTTDTAVAGSTNMSILEGSYSTGSPNAGINSSTGEKISCNNKTYCHKTTNVTGTVGAGDNYPHSPYTGGYGLDRTFAELAHLKSNHWSNVARTGCYLCHPGYSANNSDAYGYTNDVHKNRSCDFCHGNWTYLTANLTMGGGAGIPKIPSCYDCHPIFNSNPLSISTLADLIPGLDANVTGKNISVYSYNYDTKVPLTAHNSTDPSLIRSVPCIVCHGPAHNNSKPDTSLTNTNDITESSQCISCHGQRHGSATNCTGCHTMDAHDIYKPAGVDNCDLCHSSYVSAVNASKHIDNVNGFKELHTSSSDCTQCHVANTTQPFSLNTSLSTHDHNLTVEHSFFEYNISGMPLAINNGTGIGMFPYYTCSLTCHAVRTPEKVDKAYSSWLNSSHADSRSGASDSKNNCAKCKSPLNYNDTLTGTNPVIAEKDWEGIQCRVCHNLHNRSFSGISGNPAAFYNATASSYVNYLVYDKISNNTDLCEKCHQPGGSHDSKFAGTHKTALSFTCTSCHMNASFSRGMHDFQVKDSTSAVTGCEVCHAAADHTWSFTSTHSENVSCEACHDQTFTTANATNYSVSSDNYYGLWKETPTSQWTTAKKMNTSPSTWPLHNLSRSVNCSKCHEAYSLSNGSIAASLPIIRNCISCHDTGGSAPYNVDFTLSNSSNSMHRTLNFNNSNSVTLNNSKCWGCHGDGDMSEAAQPENDHPANYKTPKNCNNNDCHSISQSKYQETMIYSHFEKANLNSNSNNLTNYNITTTEQCENCHYNSLVIEDSFSKLALVSHYASKEELIDSFDCVYCHLDKDNSEDWGNATLINKDRVGTIMVNREDNNLTMFEGQTVYLGEGYSLKLIEISTLRGNALFQILNRDNIVDQVLVTQDDLYTYERETMQDNATFKTPAITILINKIFNGDKERFIKFEAYRPRKIHTEKESINSACFACHMNRYSNEKIRFLSLPTLCSPTNLISGIENLLTPI